MSAAYLVSGRINLSHRIVRNCCYMLQGDTEKRKLIHF